MERKRIVITGLSAITPLGLDLERSWEALLEGKSGIDRITQFDSSEYPTHIAGEVKNFHPEEVIPAKQARKMDRFCQLAVCSGLQAIENSGLKVDDSNAKRIGIILGVGLGGLGTIEIFHEKLRTAGPNRVSPFYIPMVISNMGPAQLAIFSGIKGTNAVSTSACASSLHAMGSAYDQLVLGRADAMITGGVESTICGMGISGFTSMKALCTDHQDEPAKASRPFDVNRSGFVMGEGAAMLVLETLEHARQRQATIYAEMVGFGASDDANHMVAPLETGEGMASCMKNALDDAGLSPEDINYISAHGTSTHANDLAETKAIHQIFGEHAKKLYITAVKSQIGHLLGAAGGAASVFAAMSLYTGNVPGTINLDNPDPECDLNYMAEGTKQLNPQYAMINAFGFGGTNASVILKRFEE